MKGTYWKCALAFLLVGFPSWRPQWQPSRPVSLPGKLVLVNAEARSVLGRSHPTVPARSGGTSERSPGPAPCAQRGPDVPEAPVPRRAHGLEAAAARAGFGAAQCFPGTLSWRPSHPAGSPRSHPTFAQERNNLYFYTVRGLEGPQPFVYLQSGVQNIMILSPVVSCRVPPPTCVMGGCPELSCSGDTLN